MSRQLLSLKRQQQHAKKRLNKIQKDLKHTQQDNLDLEKQLNFILRSKLILANSSACNDPHGGSQV